MIIVNYCMTQVLFQVLGIELQTKQKGVYWVSEIGFQDNTPQTCIYTLCTLTHTPLTHVSHPAHHAYTHPTQTMRTHHAYKPLKAHNMHPYVHIGTYTLHTIHTHPHTSTHTPHQTNTYTMYTHTMHSHAYTSARIPLRTHKNIHYSQEVKIAQLGRKLKIMIFFHCNVICIDLMKMMQSWKMICS